MCALFLRFLWSGHPSVEGAGGRSTTSQGRPETPQIHGLRLAKVPIAGWLTEDPRWDLPRASTDRAAVARLSTNTVSRPGEARKLLREVLFAEDGLEFVQGLGHRRCGPPDSHAANSANSHPGDLHVAVTCVDRQGHPAVVGHMSLRDDVVSRARVTSPSRVEEPEVSCAGRGCRSRQPAPPCARAARSCSGAWAFKACAMRSKLTIPPISWYSGCGSPRVLAEVLLVEAPPVMSVVALDDDRG